MRNLLLTICLASTVWPVPGAEIDFDTIGGLIEHGSWKAARHEIDRRLKQNDLGFQQRQDLLDLQERMHRIRLDFTKSREQILKELRAVAPEVTEATLAKWERAGSIEYLDIDGRRSYFNRAAGNVFRVNAEAKALRAKRATGATFGSPVLPEDLAEILAAYDRTGQGLNTPKRCRITYTLDVKANAVPPGETIRAWLPYPQAGRRQSEVRLVASEPEPALLSGQGRRLASVYLERIAQADKPTRFRVVFDYTALGFYQPIAPERVQRANPQDPALAPWLKEQPPHLIFDHALRQISREIVGTETNPYRQARRIFEWIDGHIPWAGAREYSTIPSLSRYALSRRWGDCGIQTMLFMTLCRYNAIPTRWESGWITGPDKNMHDWCEIYLAPYGWVPVDASFGLVNSTDPRLRWFYLGNTDSCRLVVNTDFGQPLYPAKLFSRSEPVDFQRGEVEWRGGNLYLDQWDWDFQVQPLKPE